MNDEQNPFDIVAERFTRACRAGLNPLVDDYAKRHPELADQIRNLLPSIKTIEQLGSKAESEKQFVKANAVFDRKQIEQLGDYRIVREIGRGGMGVVYEAIQQSLGRHVAIKLLMQTSTSPQHLQRFQREAKTAANLHHTNIVQVLGVGSQDGFHYYVMQLIDGLGLDQVIARLREKEQSAASDSTNDSVQGLSKGDYRAVAKLGRSVARALQYAHEHDILHRDIKPANLMLDADGRVSVTDFGLAKAMEDSDVSRTGEVVGTLRFMAPEQFAGKPDPRSDVYSLGLTIYELLTLEPAWEDTSRSHLLSGSDSRKKVQLRSPKMHDRAIPQDLETIVLKACALEPGDRYQTAAALAEDLENYLDGRPINARPPYSFEVLGKWCRRNPALASLSGLAAMLLTLVALSSSIGYLLTNAALKREQDQRSQAVMARERAEQSRQQAEDEKLRAERTLGISLKALDRVYKRFVPEHITSSNSTPGVDGETQVFSQAMLSKETAAFLEDILGFYDEFAHHDTDSVILKREAAKANWRTGDIHRQLGDYEKSIPAYQNAISMYESIGDSDLEIARIETMLATAFQKTGEHESSSVSFEHAKQLLEEMAESDGNRETQYELARTLYLMSRRPPPKPGRSRPPRSARTGSPRGAGPGPPRGERPGGGPRERSGRPPGLPPREPASAELNRAIELLKTLQSDGEASPDQQLLLAICYRELNRSPADSQRTIELLKDLCQRYPGVPEYEFELAETLCRVPTHRQSGELAEERVLRLQESLRRLDWLVEHHPNILQYQRTKAHSHYRLGVLLMHSEASESEGQANIAEAVEIQEGICRQFPDSATDASWLNRMRGRLEGSLEESRPGAPRR